MKQKEVKNLPVLPQVAMPDPLYSLDEASAVLHINDQTLVKKLRKKEVTGHKKHGRWFIFYSDIVKYIRS